jgi:Phage terminase large subunit
LGQEVWLEGANNKLATERIQGESLGRAYVDEATTISEDFWKMLLTRLSAPDAQVFATCNPANPHHFLKKDYLDREDELGPKSWHFLLGDNPWLPPDYVQALKAEYQGLWRKRYILGLWVIAEGAVYELFDEARHVLPAPTNEGRPRSMRIAVDIGWTHPTAFVKLYRYGSCWHVAEEYRKSGRTPPQVVQDLQRFIGHEIPSSVEVPPEEPAIMAMMRQAGIPNVVPAKNAVISGITKVSSMLATSSLRLDPSCEMLVEEIEGYCWDASATDRGTDAPIKVNDDLVDALRYAVARI